MFTVAFKLLNLKPKQNKKGNTQSETVKSKSKKEGKSIDKHCTPTETKREREKNGFYFQKYHLHNFTIQIFETNVFNEQNNEQCL